LLNSNISSTRAHKNVGLLTAEIGLPVWGTPANFNGFASWLRYCSDVAQRKPAKLCTMFSRLLRWYTVYIFSGSCPVTKFCQVKNSLCVQVLRSPILAALLHGTRVVGISQTLFARAAITLGTDPHSSFVLFLLSSFFLLFSSPNLSGRRLDVYHTSTHDVVLVRI